MNKFLEYLLAFKVLTLNSAKAAPSGCSGCLGSSKFLVSIGGIFVIGALIYFLGLGDTLTGILHFMDRGPSAFETKNPGNFWLKQSTDTKYDFNNVFFINPETGWAVGTNCAFYKTKSMGLTWVADSLPVDEYLQYIKFFDEDNGILLGGDKYLSTSNGGKKWNVNKTPIKVKWSVRNAYFFDVNTGWVIDNYEGDYLIKTTNAGKSWVKQNTNVKHDFENLYFFDNKTGWVCCEDGWLAYTSNGGKKWKSVYTRIKKDFSAVYFINEYTGWVVGEDITIIRTTDGGNNWTPISTYEKSLAEGMSRRSYLKDVKFLNDLTGYTIGEDGIIYSTSDGGNNWLTDRVTGYKTLNKLFILDEKNAWIAANEGVIYKLLYSKK
ncbi:MAG: YCF48-related protein [Ignavibacteriae bacterium]|nr:YCF48-related protein [Ignavibacteriota bacterium]